jgi:hypothetical protein
MLFELSGFAVERVENIFGWLEIYTEIPPTVGMTDASMKVLDEILRILAIVTKEIKQTQSRVSESVSRYR